MDFGAIARQPLLEVEGLQLQFGGVRALQDVSFEVHQGSICGLIGPNGAGKTTLFNCLSRLCNPDRGTVRFDGKPLLDVPAHAITGIGIGRTFQNVAFFESLSVLQNVMVGAHALGKAGFLASGLGIRRAAADDAAARARALELLELVGLRGFAAAPVANLPFGLQKRMEIARALAGNPRLLLLDEPAAGLNHEEVATLEALVRRVRDERGITVLLVEHHMGLVMAICDQIVVLDFGVKIAAGPPAQIRSDPAVLAAYLGNRAGATIAN